MMIWWKYGAIVILVQIFYIYFISSFIFLLLNSWYCIGNMIISTFYLILYTIIFIEGLIHKYMVSSWPVKFVVTLLLQLFSLGFTFILKPLGIKT